MTEQELVDNILRILSEKKGLDITVIDIEKQTTIADKFIIASARSTTGVKALANNLEDELSKLGEEPKSREGKQDGHWAVLDYRDVIVHIFHEETRKIYSLEQLWSDGTNIAKVED